VTDEIMPEPAPAAARTARWPWAVVGVAALVAVASTVFFWLNRPQWGYCVDGPDYGYCDDGLFSSNAIVGTVVLAVAVAGLIVAVVVARGLWRGRIVLIATALFVGLLVVAWVMQLVTLEEVPMPSDPQNGPD
jgi:hypothetical protein